MLENIREKSQGMVAKIILGFIILTFAVAGIGSYTNSVDTSVAEVNGEKITQQAFEQAYTAQRNRMAQQFGEMFDTLASDEQYLANMRNGVLDNLINEKLLDQNANNLAIRISDDRIKETIRTMPEFQVDGQFDNNRYLALINQAGFFQSSDFRDYLRIEMTRRQLTQSIVASEFSLPYQTKMVNELRGQTRDLRFAKVNTEQFKSLVDVSEEEVKTHYQANLNSFQNAEKVKLDYVLLDATDIAAAVNVDEEAAERFYKDNIAQYSTAEKRRIAHILIEDGEGADKLAADVQTKLDAGVEFAELAKAHSADTFSAENGGDLDYFEAGIYGDDFDAAVMSLNAAGEVTSAIKTEAGTHFIKMTEYVAKTVTPFEEVKAEVMATAASDEAQNQFYDLQQTLAQISFESPDSLDEAADSVGGEVKTSDWLNRAMNAAPFDNRNVLEAAFSDMILSENLNSDIIELSSTQAIVIRLNEYQAAEVKPLEEVAGQIKTKLIAEKATEEAKNKVADILAKFQSGDDVSANLTELGASFEDKAAVARFGSDLDSSLTRHAFTLPHPVEGAVSADTVALSNGDIAIVQIQAVNASTQEAPAQLEQQFAQQLAQSAFVGYVGQLKEEAEIVRRELSEPVAMY